MIWEVEFKGMYNDVDLTIRSAQGHGARTLCQEKIGCDQVHNAWISWIV